MSALGKFVKQTLLRRFILSRGATADAAVYLTFDDGPHAEHTPRLLEALRQEGATATFFLNGTEVEKHRGLAAAMLREGHTVGNHFFSHRSVADLSWEEMSREIERGEAAIQGDTGRLPRLIRPPYGAIDAKLLWYAWKRDRKIALWSVDPEDGDSGRDAFAENGALSDIRPGDIVLLHEDNLRTVESLPRLLQDLKRRGLQPKGLPEEGTDA